MRLPVLLFDIMYVVGGNQTDIKFFGEIDKVGNNFFLVGIAVVLDFDIEILSEDFLHFGSELLRAVVIPFQKQAGNTPCQTR